MLKRAFDIVFACLLGIVLAPVAAFAAIAVRTSLGRPVLFRQIRPGLDERPFILYKFRTMRAIESADPAGVDPGRAMTDSEDQARLTRVGRILRALSVDELPQLWNVVRGDMSLVGPRPLLTEYLPHYTVEQARRHHVRPGVTGLAQVRGRQELEWDRRFALDVHYVEHRSFAMDLWILWRTARGLLVRDAPSEDLQPFSHSGADEPRTQP